MPRKPTQTDAVAPPQTFLRRHRKTIGGIFWIFLVLTILVTLFQPAIYEATAVVGLPAAADPDAEAKALEAPDVLRETMAKVTQPEAPDLDAHATSYTVAMPGRFALIAESDSRDYSMAVADAWAETVVADSSGKGHVLMRADGPHYPVRPKKAKSILIGALMGLLLGFFIAGLKEANLRSSR
jgi:hypothetical protein